MKDHDSLKVETEKAIAFLDLLSEHLKSSEMSSKARDCVTVARRLRAAIRREANDIKYLDWCDEVSP